MPYRLLVSPLRGGWCNRSDAGFNQGQPKDSAMSRVTAIGLMSGTSYDGVDVALIETDGEEIGRLGPTGYRPYSDPEREVVRRAIAVAANLTDRSARPAMLAAA